MGSTQGYHYKENNNEVGRKSSVLCFGGIDAAAKLLSSQPWSLIFNYYNKSS
jgi:hypothetical protein